MVLIFCSSAYDIITRLHRKKMQNTVSESQTAITSIQKTDYYFYLQRSKFLMKVRDIRQDWKL
jgi:hypothetical protein